ncbi:MAG: glucosamine--fructose-6-phosphate aminotransferase [Pseudomonadota bacterium]
MGQLPKSLNAFGSSRFNQIVKQELATFKSAEFPLHQATTQGGLVDDKQISVSVLSSIEKEKDIQVKLSVFFDEIVGGCSCGDPPMQVNNYCELLLAINKETAQATFQLLKS